MTWSRSKFAAGLMARPLWRASCLMTSLLAVAAILAGQPTIETHEYPLPEPADLSKVVSKITEGPDGAMWFTASCGYSPCPSNYHETIGRITRDGVITEFELPSTTLPAGTTPFGITTGPDGALWFAELYGNKIGRVTTAGLLTEYPLPVPSYPYEITVGPDGALWFTELNPGSAIGRITITGDITIYPLGTSSNPYDIVVGPDSALWFTDVNRVGRITVGGQTSFFPTPDGCNPGGIATWPGDKDVLWITCSNSYLGRMTTAGLVTSYRIPTADSQPTSISTGPDGALWFSEQNGCKFGRLSLIGQLTELPGAHACGEIALGLGALWTNTPQYSITRVIVNGGQDTTPPVITPHISGNLGNDGWYTSVVTVSWTVTDAESGITSSSGCNTTTLTSDTPGVTITCSATNGAGLTASAPVTIKIRIGADSTPPVITPRITGILGNNGWYGSDVGVDWSFTDPESGIASTVGCSHAILSADTLGVTLSCSATNGAGLSASASVFIRIDRTPPGIQPHVTGTLGSNGWYISPVTVSWTVVDPVSGVASSSSDCRTTTTLTASTAGVVLGCVATNGAGLTNDATIFIKIDLTQPWVDVTGKLQIAVSGFALNRLTNTLSGTVTLKNITADTIQGPFYFIPANLGPDSILRNATGVRLDNTPYLLVDGLTALAPGATASVRVQFRRTAAAITFDPKFFVGGL